MKTKSWSQTTSPRKGGQEGREGGKKEGVTAQFKVEEEMSSGAREEMAREVGKKIRRMKPGWNNSKNREPFPVFQLMFLRKVSGSAGWWSEAWSPFLSCIGSEGGIERAVAEGQQGLGRLDYFPGCSGKETIEVGEDTITGTNASTHMHIQDLIRASQDLQEL